LGRTVGSCHLRDRRERPRWSLAGPSVIAYAVAGWWRRASSCKVVCVGGRLCLWTICGRGRSAGGIRPAVAHLTVALPNSSNAVRPQHLREHHDTGEPRADNSLTRARHGVNRPEGTHPLGNIDPCPGFRLVAGVVKPRRSWRLPAPTLVPQARAA